MRACACAYVRSKGPANLAVLTGPPRHAHAFFTQRIDTDTLTHNYNIMAAAKKTNNQKERIKAKKAPRAKVVCPSLAHTTPDFSSALEYCVEARMATLGWRRRRSARRRRLPASRRR